MKRIAIQGTLGSYHDIAAHKYFEGEEIELICCATFEDVFAAVKKDSKTIGMLAIENTIAGSLLHNNELLRQSGTQIIGEYKLRISHSFVCLPDEDWNDLTEVNSHPIALMQCREFLAQHPKMKVVVRAGNVTAIFSKSAGSLCGYEVGGRQTIDTPLRLNLFRLPTDNDKPHTEGWDKAGLSRLTVAPGEWKINTDMRNATLNLSITDVYRTAGGDSFTVAKSFDVVGDGIILADMRIVPAQKDVILP